MKKFILICLLGLVGLSCVKERQEVLPSFTNDPVFYATFGDETEPATKAYADEQLRGRWDAGDHISIFNKNTINREYAFQGQTGDNSGSFKKVPSEDFYAGNPLSYVYAVYPYSESTSISDDGELAVFLPAEQSYRENTYGLGANTMVAITEEDELMFKNLCGYFAVKLYGENVAVKSISLKGNDNEPLAGKASVIAAMDAVPTLTFDVASATKEILLSFDTAVTIGSTDETAMTFWFVVPPTTFERGITLTVTDDNNYLFKKVTSGSLEIKRNTLKKSSPLQVVFPIVPEAVDLGLSVKWASFNLGASAPEEYGDYYAWGETAPKDDNYSWPTYKLCNGSYSTLTKYNNRSIYGTVDNKTEFKDYDYEDDAARQALGGNWRMPTEAEWTELRNNCTWTWVTNYNGSGINGRLVKSKTNSNSIFLPAAGYRLDTYLDNVGSYGSYWSSSLDTGYPGGAWDVYFYSGGVDRGIGYRYYGQSVRPVRDDQIHPISVSLDKTSLSMFAGGTDRLTATVSPDNATDKRVIWTSDNTLVATVDAEGNVTAVAPGSATITVTTTDGGKTASCIVSVAAHPEAVDLGLSVKWASFNIGAFAPEEYGDYFAWGEILPKEEYSWETYKWCNGSETTLTKYNTKSENGTVDNKTTLELEDDAAHVNWGGTWRMPTQTEVQELVNNCTSVWTTENDVYGRRFTSKKEGYADKSIFIPFAGGVDGGSLINAGSIGYYWSSFSSGYLGGASRLYIVKEGAIEDFFYYARRYGLPIRPVCP